MAGEVELFKNEKAKSSIWNHFKLKKENQKKLSTTLQYVIIVMRQLSIQVGYIYYMCFVFILHKIRVNVVL